MNNGLPVTPSQKFYEDLVGHHEFNLGTVFDIHPECRLQYESLKKAAERVVKSQPYLRSVHDQENDCLRTIPVEQALQVHEYEHEPADDEAIKQWLEAIIKKTSQSVSHFEGALIELVLCQVGDMQRLILVANHYAFDGDSLLVFMMQLDRSLKGKLVAGLPSKKSLVNFEKSMDKYKNFSKDSLGYWQKEFKQKPLDPTNLNGNQRILISKFNSQKTKQVLADIKKTNLRFDVLMIAAFSYAFFEVMGRSPNAISIDSSMRKYFNDLSVWRLIGYLVFSYPLFLAEVKPDSLLDARKQVLEQFDQVKGRELNYMMACYDEADHGVVPFDYAEIGYSNVGDMDQAYRMAKMVNPCQLYDTYFHGNTFDPEMRSYREMFIRPFRIDGCLNLAVFYNHKQFEASKIQELADLTLKYFQDLIGLC